MVGVEESTVRARQSLMRAGQRSVVAGKDEDRIIIEAEFGDEHHHAPDFAIHARDHRRIRSLRLEMWQIARASGIGRVVKLADVFLK